VPLPFLSLVVSTKSLVALGAIALLTFAHLRGLGPGRLVQNTLASGKVIGLFIFLVAGFALGAGHLENLRSSAPVAADGVVLALIPVMFAYSGWNAASYVAEEIRSPGRNVPIALGLGTLVVIVIYMGLNTLYLYALGPAGLATVSGTLADTVAEHLFGFVAATLIALFTIVSLSASISAMVLAGPRVYFAMARDGVFFKGVAYVSERSRAPVVAIAVQGIWASVIALSGRYEQILNYVVALDAVFFGLTGAALLVLRRREPRSVDGGFRMPGHPWTTIVFVAAFWSLAVNTVIRNPRSAGIGVLILIAGIPAYLFWHSAPNANFRDGG
jgi:APA family basic amino acid/polyamine antiporter